MTPRAPYAELHCHSAFSLSDGASTPEALAERAAELGYRALALTDHDDLGGAIRFARACDHHGIQPLHGAELTLSDGAHLTLLVESERGWRNLSALITLARSARPRGEPGVPLAALEERAEGLIALSGCPRGSVPRLLAEGKEREAAAAAGALREIFGGRFHLEVQDHHTYQEARLRGGLMALAERTGIPWTVTHDVHHAKPEGRSVHDLLVALRAKATLDEAERRGLLRPSAEWCLQPPERMARRWRHRPEGIRRTLEIAERCAFRLQTLRPAPPAFPLPEGWESADAYLAHLARTGLRARMGEPPAGHLRQLERELEIIRGIGMADHFLIVWDICRFARERGILCQGRGSAANSLVCYATRVTAVDPVAHDLLFERFVSVERPEPPDIDIDFAAGDAREEVLQYVYRLYGREHAAMVCTTIDYRGRSAVRDTLRGLGFPPEVQDWLAKRVEGHAGTVSAAEWLEADGGSPLQAIGVEPDSPTGKAIVRLVRGLRGLPRHRGIHPGGFVLSGAPLGEIVPVENAAMAGRSIVQWDKDDCADIGLPKFDLLGLGMLQLLGECLDHVEKWRGRRLDIGRLPLDDAAVYAQASAADNVGLFQIESRAQANFLPRLKPRVFYDLVISVGAIRPGPMLGGQVREMLARRRGEERTEYPHPALQEVLERTHGLALFQEQLMRCAIVVSGCTPGQADALRRAMSRKRSKDDMRRTTDAIREGMRRRGVDPESAERVLAWLEACASYTFPESHAISFALLAYASAWLRLHYPAEYLCAILNAQPMGFYPVSTLVHDAIDHGVEVRPLDLAHSAWDCTLEEGVGGEPRVASRESRVGGSAVAGGERSAAEAAEASPPAVRIGLRYVRGLGPHAGKRLKAALEGGPFRSLEEVIERSGMEEAELRALAAAGAFRSLVPGDAREALWAVLGALRERRSGGPLSPAAHPPAALPRMNPVEVTLADHRTVGFTLTGHPMRHLRERLAILGVEAIDALRQPGRRNGEEVRTAGVVIVRQRPGTAKGFVFVGLEDETGRLDVIVSPQVYARVKETLNTSALLAVAGRLGREDGVVNLRAERFFPLTLREGEPVIRSHDYH